MAPILRLCQKLLNSGRSTHYKLSSGTRAEPRISEEGGGKHIVQKENYKNMKTMQTKRSVVEIFRRERSDGQSSPQAGIKLSVSYECERKITHNTKETRFLRGNQNRENHEEEEKHPI